MPKEGSAMNRLAEWDLWAKAISAHVRGGDDFRYENDEIVRTIAARQS